MYEVFYVDKRGNYGEGDEMFLIDPTSLPQETRDEIQALLNEGRGLEVYQLIEKTHLRNKGFAERRLIKAGNCRIYQATKRNEMLAAVRRLKVSIKEEYPEGLFTRATE